MTLTLRARFTVPNMRALECFPSLPVVTDGTLVAFLHQCTPTQVRSRYLFMTDYKVAPGSPNSDSTMPLVGSVQPSRRYKRAPAILAVQVASSRQSVEMGMNHSVKRGRSRSSHCSVPSPSCNCEELKMRKPCE